MSDRKVVKITGHGVAVDSRLGRIELMITDTSLRYHDISTRLDPRVTPVSKQSFKVEDRDRSKLQVSLEGNFFVSETKRAGLALRKNIEKDLKIILHNQTITLNPELYYGHRLYNVLEMDLPELLLPGSPEAVFLGSASSRSYDATELVFNEKRVADLDKHLRDGVVHYEIKVTRYDGQSTLPNSGSLSFEDIKKRKSRNFVLLSGVPTSAFNLSSLQFSYRVTTRGGNQIDAFEDEKKDFLQVKVKSSGHQLIDLKAVNKAHRLDSLYLKYLLDGKDLFKYLDIAFPQFRVFYDPLGEVTYNGVHRLELSSTVRKKEHELLLDMTALASIVYLDKKSFLRVKGLAYLQAEPSAGVVNFSYEVFDENSQRLHEEKYIGRCHFRKVGKDVASAQLFNLQAQGEAYFFELDIKDPLEESDSTSYYRIDLSSAFSEVIGNQSFFFGIDFYYNQKLTFSDIVKELDLPYEGLDITPAISASKLEGFLEDHVLAYTSIPFSFERMAQDVFIEDGFPEALEPYISIHGYSNAGRKIFSTQWSDKPRMEAKEAWWRGVDILVLCIWMNKDVLSAKPSPYSRRAEREFEGGEFDSPYYLAITGKLNPYAYIPCLKGNHDYELDPLFSNTLYVGQGRSKVQGRGSANTLYLMWDSHTTFDFAAEEDFQRGLAPSRLKLMGVELQNISIQVPGVEHELWGSIILQWALLLDPKQELATTQDSAVIALLQDSHAALKEGSLTLVNFLKEPISEFLEFEIKGRLYTLEVSANDGKIYWRRQVDLSREPLGAKTVLRQWPGKTEYVLRNTILGEANIPIYPSDDGQDILVARGEVAYLHGGKNETQLVGHLPENFFYLNQGGSDNVIANGYRNSIEISSALGGTKVLFLSTKKDAINFISAPTVSFRSAQIKDDDVFFFLETEAHLLTICLKSIVAWDKARQSRVSLALEEGTFNADQLIEALKFSERVRREETYQFQAVFAEPALQQGFVQLADRVAQRQSSKDYLKDQIRHYDVVEKE
ncbi:hypothetical protein [Pseudomonas sp. FEN]|uniref:hypothetical protein n=1 Tax=Pseudomonas sp. FEN TaxID=2767468 RepID=UPI00174E6892|nr:hypothetical protein [Pseudomonas sp. FEN]